MTITQKDQRTLVRLLGYLQDQLECEIECATLPAGAKKVPRTAKQLEQDALDRRIVRAARLKWKSAEEMVKKLSKGLNITG